MHVTTEASSLSSEDDDEAEDVDVADAAGATSVFGAWSEDVTGRTR